jgi:hypothetical protein
MRYFSKHTNGVVPVSARLSDCPRLGSPNGHSRISSVDASISSVSALGPASASVSASPELKIVKCISFKFLCQLATLKINANFIFSTHSFATLRNPRALARFSAGSRSLDRSVSMVRPVATFRPFSRHRFHLCNSNRRGVYRFSA